MPYYITQDKSLTDCPAWAVIKKAPDGSVEKVACQPTKESANLVLRQLNRRIGGISAELSANIQSLSLENLENLGEALLDFQSVEDLEQWLENERF